MEKEFTGLVIRVSVIYIYTLIALRLAGKRTIGGSVGSSFPLTAFDLLVGLIIGDLFDDMFWKEVPLIQGFVALTTIVALHLIVAYFSYKSKAFNSLVSSRPTPVIRDGKLEEPGMRKERTSEDTVFESLRLEGEAEDDLPEVREALWEPSGQLSVLKQEEAKPVQKADLPRLKELFQ